MAGTAISTTVYWFFRNSRGRIDIRPLIAFAL